MKSICNDFLCVMHSAHTINSATKVFEEKQSCDLTRVYNLVRMKNSTIEKSFPVGGVLRVMCISE